VVGDPADLVPTGLDVALDAEAAVGDVACVDGAGPAVDPPAAGAGEPVLGLEAGILVDIGGQSHGGFQQAGLAPAALMAATGAHPVGPGHAAAAKVSGTVLALGVLGGDEECPAPVAFVAAVAQEDAPGLIRQALLDPGRAPEASEVCRQGGQPQLLQHVSGFVLHVVQAYLDGSRGGRLSSVHPPGIGPSIGKQRGMQRTTRQAWRQNRPSQIYRQR
jgi:hypothetical protein